MPVPVSTSENYLLSIYLIRFCIMTFTTNNSITVIVKSYVKEGVIKFSIILESLSLNFVMFVFQLLIDFCYVMMT